MTMNDDRWMVDTTGEILHTNFLKGAMDLITCVDNEHVFGRVNGWVQEFNTTEVRAMRDFIIELVAEIERMQTENIELEDQLHQQYKELGEYWSRDDMAYPSSRIYDGISEALRPADGDTKWAERFKGLYGEGHYE